jgi:hypothetical protein
MNGTTHLGDDTDFDLEYAVAEYKQAKIALEKAKQYIQDRLGMCEKMIVGCHTIAWPWVKGARKTNWRAIALELNASQELIDKHTETAKPTRRFSIT